MSAAAVAKGIYNDFYPSFMLNQGNLEFLLRTDLHNNWHTYKFLFQSHEYYIVHVNNLNKNALF